LIYEKIGVSELFRNIDPNIPNLSLYRTYVGDPIYPLEGEDEDSFANRVNLLIDY